VPNALRYGSTLRVATNHISVQTLAKFRAMAPFAPSNLCPGEGKCVALRATAAIIPRTP
jgi:hypothetical protein